MAWWQCNYSVCDPAIRPGCIYYRRMGFVNDDGISCSIALDNERSINMTTETVFIKLAFLLSNYPVKEVKELLHKNLADEFNERILPDQYFEER